MTEKNVMKPGWEQTLMAEDIFKNAIGGRLATGYHPNEEVITHIAENSIQAAFIWQRIQKNHKLPHVITSSIDKDE